MGKYEKAVGDALTSFVWKGEELRTMGQLGDACLACKTKKEMQEFMKEYRACCAFADRNIGYWTGYLDQKKADRIRDWAGVTHPIFGRKHPTAEEAFAAGLKMGKASLRRKK